MLFSEGVPRRPNLSLLVPAPYDGGSLAAAGAVSTLCTDAGERSRGKKCLL